MYTSSKARWECHKDSSAVSASYYYKALMTNQAIRQSLYNTPIALQGAASQLAGA